MRRFAAALLVSLSLVACEESSGEMCEEPTTVTRPERPSPWRGDETQCAIVSLCMIDVDCTDEACANDCMAQVFGASDCGCCGADCDATCDEVREGAIAVAIACNEDLDADATAEDYDRCTEIGNECNTLGFDDRG